MGGQASERSRRVEWRQDELFPRVGFIVTTMSVSTERVVHFYDGRGTAELWIKEGKYALNCPNPPELPQVRGRPGAVGSVHPFEMQGRPPTGRPLTYSADGDRAA